MNGFQCGFEQEDRLLFGSRPPRLAVDALPKHVKLRVEQDDRFAASASRTTNLVLVEDLMDGNVASHNRHFGRDASTR
jgi:hypothetical protein